MAAIGIGDFFCVLVLMYTMRTELLSAFFSFASFNVCSLSSPQNEVNKEDNKETEKKEEEKKEEEKKEKKVKKKKSFR